MATSGVSWNVPFQDQVVLPTPAEGGAEAFLNNMPCGPYGGIVNLIYDADGPPGTSLSIAVVTNTVTIIVAVDGDGNVGSLLSELQALITASPAAAAMLTTSTNPPGFDNFIIEPSFTATLGLVGTPITCPGGGPFSYAY